MNEKMDIAELTKAAALVEQATQLENLLWQSAFTAESAAKASDAGLESRVADLVIAGEELVEQIKHLTGQARATCRLMFQASLVTADAPADDATRAVEAASHLVRALALPLRTREVRRDAAVLLAKAAGEENKAASNLEKLRKLQSQIQSQNQPQASAQSDLPAPTA